MTELNVDACNYDNKANNNQEGVLPDDTTAKFDNPRVEYLSEYLHRTKGTSTGIVQIFTSMPLDRSQGSVDIAQVQRQRLSSVTVAGRLS